MNVIPTPNTPRGFIVDRISRLRQAAAILPREDGQDFSDEADHLTIEVLAWSEDEIRDYAVSIARSEVRHCRDIGDLVAYRRADDVRLALEHTADAQDIAGLAFDVHASRAA